MNSTYIVVLNWNGWRDTIKCLGSLLKLNSKNYKIVICDNDSTDGSIEHIIEWIKSKKIINSKIFCMKYYGEKFENNIMQDDGQSIFIIKNSKNSGYAGGNNVGIKFILENDDYDFIWILNNDTIVDGDSLNALVRRMQSDSKLGICGSLLIHEDDHNLVQACGAKYSKWLARSSHIADMENRRDLHLFRDNKIDFTVGASMMVSRSFVSSVGLMNEDYFLYFEELDWITRAGSEFKFAIEPSSIVYHKQGASTGATGMAVRRSRVSQYYQARGRILYTKKFYWFYLPTVLLSVVCSLIFSLLRRDWASARSIILGILDGLIGVTGRRDTL